MKRKLGYRIVNHLRSYYERIEVVPKQGLFNFRCFDNVVQFAKDNEGYGVVEVMYIDGSVPILHYVNVHLETGVYYETTLGFKAENLEYYKLRTIPPIDYPLLSGEFDRAMTTWTNDWSRLWQRKLFKIERLV